MTPKTAFPLRLSRRLGTWLLAAGLTLPTLACDDEPKPVAKQEPAKAQPKPEKAERKRPPRKAPRRHDTAGREGYPEIPGIPAILQPNAVAKYKQRAVLKSGDTVRFDKQGQGQTIAAAPRDYEGLFRVMVLEPGDPMRVASWHRGVRLAYYVKPSDALMHTTQATRVSSEPKAPEGGDKPADDEEVGIWLARGTPVEPALPSEPSDTKASATAPAKADNGELFKVHYDRHGIEFEGYVPKSVTGAVFEPESFDVPEKKLDLGVGPRPKPAARRGKARMRRPGDPRDMVRSMDGMPNPLRRTDPQRNPAPPAAEGKNAPGDLKAAEKPSGAPAGATQPARAKQPTAGAGAQPGSESTTTDAVLIYAAPGGDVLAKAKLSSGDDMYTYAVAGGEKRDNHQLVTFYYEDLILRGWVKQSDLRPATRFDKPTDERGRRQPPDRAPKEWRRLARGTLLYDKPKGEVVGAMIWRRRMNTSQAEPGWLKVDVDLGFGATATVYAEDKPDVDPPGDKDKKRKKRRQNQDKQDRE